MSRSPLFGGRDRDTAVAGVGSGSISAFLDQGTEFEGRLSFKESVRIDGKFRGEISSEGALIVGPSAEIEATIHARTVLVGGRVTGDIHTSEKLVLDESGEVEGDVDTPELVINDGAVLNGRIVMNKPAGEPHSGAGSAATKAPAPGAGG